MDRRYNRSASLWIPYDLVQPAQTLRSRFLPGARTRETITERGLFLTVNSLNQADPYNPLVNPKPCLQIAEILNDQLGEDRVE